MILFSTFCRRLWAGRWISEQSSKTGTFWPFIALCKYSDPNWYSCELPVSHLVVYSTFSISRFPENMISFEFIKMRLTVVTDNFW